MLCFVFLLLPLIKILGKDKERKMGILTCHFDPNFYFLLLLKRGCKGYPAAQAVTLKGTSVASRKLVCVFREPDETCILLQVLN